MEKSAGFAKSVCHSLPAFLCLNAFMSLKGHYRLLYSNHLF